MRLPVKVFAARRRAPGAGRLEGRGTSLVEVLVALTLVAVTMLGLLALQFRSMGAQKDSSDYRSAALMAADFTERVTSNFAGFANGAYTGLSFPPDTALPAAPACATNPCTPAEVAALDFWNLERAVSTYLPGGVAYVNTAATGAWATVTIGWIDPGRTAETTTGTFGPDPLCAAQNIADTRYRCYAANVFP